MKGCSIISEGEILRRGLKSSILNNMSMNWWSLSRPWQSYFFSVAGKLLNIYYYFYNIFFPSLPCTPNRPVPIMLLPLLVDTLPLSDSHKGNPVSISNSIAPSDHTSYDQGCNFLQRLVELVPLAIVFYALLSRYSRTSGDRYSGVLA
jgi:hypothetical protein